MSGIGKHHGRFGTGMAQLMFELARGVEWVGVDYDQSRAKRTKKHDWVLQNIGHLDGDAIAFFELGDILQKARQSRPRGN